MAKVTMKARKEVIERSRKGYAKAGKKEKGQILNHVCASTGISRDRAKRLLGGSGYKTQKKRKPGRKVIYDEAFKSALEKVWGHMGFPCGKLLVAGMKDVLAALVAHKEFQGSEEIITKLETVSAATVDRLLSKARKGLTLKGKSTTKPGTLLKKDIPYRMGNEWNDAVPGFVEIDLVAHCGESTAGEYVNTLDVTDICTGWTETIAVINKAERHVFAGLVVIGNQQPFPYRGIDSDNGSEFINHHLLRWCKKENILFTRSRPYRKNDNCHVEQKNWHIVRRNIGYGRYEGQEAVDALNAYYADLRLYSNFFMPQAKLISKERINGRIKKKYDKPQTPYRRCLESGHVSEEAKKALQKTYETLNPAFLQRAMDVSLDYIYSHQASNRQKNKPGKEGGEHDAL
jgi:hypothetical protein